MRSIEKIQVEKLFGHYDYFLGKKIPENESNPFIIYGDNGSGKTTLLRVIFYLISTVNNAGHKTNISRTKFKRFSVIFEGGIEISAERDGGELIGSYSLLVKENGEVRKSVFLEANSELAIRVGESDIGFQQEYNEILSYIKELNISIHYLSDKRKLFAGSEDFIDGEKNLKDIIMTRRVYERALLEGRDASQTENEIEISVRNLEGWIKKHVLQGSKQGDENTNSIYSSLIKRVSTRSSKNITKKDMLRLVKKISTIREESELYVDYGLISKIETKDIEKSLDSEVNSEIIYNILVPYVEGLSSRLNSLKEIQAIIELFVKSINDYFSTKEVKYHLANGFSIVDKGSKEPLELNMLSSGEVQLLLLFCNVITASDDASIFIIDEPEISLNIKWQRKLIDTLLLFSHNKNVQFIFASHSIELLSAHKKSVHKLEHRQL